MTRNKEYYKLRAKIKSHTPKRKQIFDKVKRGSKITGRAIKSGSIKVAKASGQGLKKFGEFAGTEMKKSYKQSQKRQRRPVRRKDFKEPKSEFIGFGTVGPGLGFNDAFGGSTKRKSKKKKSKRKQPKITIEVH